MDRRRPEDAPALEIRLLGPFEVRRDGTPVALPGKQLATVIGVLALSANRPVPTGALADRVWGERPPRQVQEALYTYVHRIRSLLGGDAVDTQPAGYALRVPAEQVDALRLAELLRSAARTPDPEPRRRLLDRALELWRDVPFAGSPSEWLATGEAARLTELYLTAAEQRIDLDLAERRYDDLPARLADLSTRHPLRESTSG